jgi:hypothetical protein
VITRPIIILGAPRSGTTILLRCLSLHRELWHLPNESHWVFEGPFHPARSGYESNRVTADDAGDALVHQLRTTFLTAAINLSLVVEDHSRLLRGSSLKHRLFTKLAIATIGRLSRLRKPDTIRFLEKTPKNMLRVPLLTRLFPDAYFIFLTRGAARNIDSLIAGWFATDKIGPFTRRRYAQAGYPIVDQLRLQDYHDNWWKFALVPGWRDLQGKTVADVAAWQYYQCNTIALNDLSEVPSSRQFRLQFEDFVQRPGDLLGEILEWAGLPPSPVIDSFARALPRVNDATPQLRRDRTRFRYPDALSGALERLPQINQLQDAMGYPAAGT